MDALTPTTTPAGEAALMCDRRPVLAAWLSRVDGGRRHFELADNAPALAWLDRAAETGLITLSVELVQRRRPLEHVISGSFSLTELGEAVVTEARRRLGRQP